MWLRTHRHNRQDYDENMMDGQNNKDTLQNVHTDQLRIQMKLRNVGMTEDLGL